MSEKSKSTKHKDKRAAIYSTVSRPFDPPKIGKTVVKVTNHTATRY